MDAGTQFVVVLTTFMAVLGAITGPVILCFSFSRSGAVRYVLLIFAILQGGLFAVGVMMLQRI